MSRIEQAINQIRSGNSTGINYLYEQFYVYLFKRARNAGLCIEDAEEVTHNTFLKIIKEIHKFEYRNDNSFKAWILKIHKNHINEFYRKRRIQFEYLDDENKMIAPDSEYFENSTNLLTNDPRLEIIKTEIEKLSEDDQILLTMRAQGDSYEMIGEILGVNPKTLKVRYHRLKNKLEERLKNIFKENNLL